MSHGGTVVPDRAPSAEGPAGRTSQPHYTCMLSSMKLPVLVFRVPSGVVSGLGLCLPVATAKLFLMKLTPNDSTTGELWVQLTYF